MPTTPRHESSIDAGALFDCVHFMENLRMEVSSAEAIANSAANLLSELPYIQQLQGIPETETEGLSEHTRRIFGRLQALVVLTAEAMDAVLSHLSWGIDQAYEHERHMKASRSDFRRPAPSHEAPDEAPAKGPDDSPDDSSDDSPDENQANDWPDDSDDHGPNDQA